MKLKKKSLPKRIFNNVFWLGLSEVSSKVLMFLGTVYLARVLGIAGFGLYSLSLTVGVYFWMVVDMGVIGYGTREIARDKEQTAELYSILNSLRFVLAIILITIFCVILYFIDMPFEEKLVLLAGAFYAVAFSLSADWVFRGLEKMQHIIIGRMTTSLFFLGGIYLLVKTPSDVLLASILYSCSFLVGSIAFVILLSKKFKIRFSLRIYITEWLFHIKKSFYFALNFVLNYISFFTPIVFMGFWSTYEELGIFSVSHRLMLLVIGAGLLIVLALYPTLTNLYATNKDDFIKTYTISQKFLTSILMPICIIVTVLSKEIVVFLYGVSYAESGAILNILIWLAFLAIIRRSIGNALYSAGFHRFNIFASGAGAVVNMLISIALIPRYNAIGAAWALIGGEIVALIAMSVLFRQKVYDSNFLTSYFIKVLLSGILMGLIIITLPFSMFVNIVIGILFYVLVSFYVAISGKKPSKSFI